MSKNSEAVKKWRKNTKLKVIQSMGGCCQICGYNKCPEAMDLHHIDPTQKEISFGRVTANPKAWKSTIIPELKKCILLCSNCHREFHSGYVVLPEKFCEFDESLISEKINSEMFDHCPICNSTKAVINNYCSVKCCSKGTNNLNNRLVMNIDEEKLIEMVNKGYKRKDIANYFSCSGNTIWLRMKKLNIVSSREKFIWPSPTEIQSYIWKMSLSELSKYLEIPYESIRIFTVKHKLYRPTKDERMAHVLGIEPSSTV